MKNRWIMCPCCKGKTRIKIREDTELYKFPLFCPKCKREQIINVLLHHTRLPAWAYAVCSPDRYTAHFLLLHGSRSFLDDFPAQDSR